MLCGTHACVFTHYKSPFCITGALLKREIEIQVMLSGLNALVFLGGGGGGGRAQVLLSRA